MVPPDVCDAKQPVLGPSGGPEIDVTVAASPPRVVASGALNIGRSSSEVAHRVRSSIWRLCEHRMVPPDVCDAKQPVLGPSGGPEIDVTVAASPPRVVASGALNIGRSLAEVAHRVRSSIWRLCEHRMVPPDVCDAKQPVLGPSGGPEIDVTVAASPPSPRSASSLGQRLRRCVVGHRTRSSIWRLCEHRMAPPDV